MREDIKSALSLAFLNENNDANYLFYKQSPVCDVNAPRPNVKEGDIIHIQFGNSSVTARVLRLLDSCKKDDAATMYEIVE